MPHSLDSPKCILGKITQVPKQKLYLLWINRKPVFIHNKQCDRLYSVIYTFIRSGIHTDNRIKWMVWEQHGILARLIAFLLCSYTWLETAPWDKYHTSVPGTQECYGSLRDVPSNQDISKGQKSHNTLLGVPNKCVAQCTTIHETLKHTIIHYACTVQKKQ